MFGVYITPIAVSQRMPEPLTPVLVDHTKNSSGWLRAVLHEDGEWWEATEHNSYEGSGPLEVTHWIPMPDLTPPQNRDLPKQSYF